MNGTISVTASESIKEWDHSLLSHIRKKDMKNLCPRCSYVLSGPYKDGMNHLFYCFR